MIGPLPRPLHFDAPAPPQAVAFGVGASDCDALHLRPTPVEPPDPAAPVRREQPQAASWQEWREAEAERERFADPERTTPHRAGRRPHGAEPRPGLNSASFLAQLIGQDDAPRDAVSAGRSQTSFRVSHVEKYEQVLRWTRQVELLFSFDALSTPYPA